MKTKAAFLVLALAVLAPGWAAAERISTAFSDPARPGLIKINLMNGGVTVKGYNGRDVIVETSTRESSSEEATRGSLRRIPNTASGLVVEEENNVMTIGTESMNRRVDLNVQVPQKTSLTIKTMNNGNIEVSGVDGEFDINALNGGLSMSQVSGTVVAHAMNGKVMVTMVRADGKPMAFSSFNGTVDVTLPPATKATLVMQTENGEIYSDFDIATQASAPQTVVEDARSKGGKYRVRVDKAVRGAVNGGGPEIRFKTFNGNIFIRKAGAS